MYGSKLYAYCIDSRVFYTETILDKTFVLAIAQHNSTAE